MKFDPCNYLIISVFGKNKYISYLCISFFDILDQIFENIIAEKFSQINYNNTKLINMKNNIIYQQSYGGREKYFTKKNDLRTADCVVRACAHASGLEYFQVMKRLFEIGLEMKLMPNNDKVFEAFLIENGFSKRQSPLKRNGNRRYKVREFPVDESKVYVIHTSRHLTCIDQGLHKDSWNCGGRAAQSYYVR